MEGLYKDWKWSERFPSRQEVLRYFQYVDEKLDLSKDVMLNTRVDGAGFDTKSCRWNVKLSTGEVINCKFFVICTGHASKQHVPNFEGLGNYKGIMHHTGQIHFSNNIFTCPDTPLGLYPQGGIDVIGTGASGVQCIQEIGPEAGHLTVFQRTPNLCLPMNQQKLDSDAQTEQGRKSYYDWAQKYMRGTFASMHFDFNHKSGADDTAEQNKSFYEGLWSTGGFPF